MAQYQQKPPPYNPGYGYQAQPAYPQPGYPQPQPGYPQPQPYYQATPGYQPAPQQTSNNNVIVVNQQPAVQQRVYVRDDSPNHILHFIITLLFWPWIFVWIILCLVHGC